MISAKTQSVTVDTMYKGHDIRAAAWELLVPIGWEPQLYVSWLEDGYKITKSFTLNQIFSTRKEAKRAGLSFALRWIDDGKPDLNQV